MTFEIVAVLFLLFSSAFFSGEEAAFLALPEIRLHTLMQKGDKRALIVHKLKENLRKLLGTLLLGQTFCDIAGSSIATYAATKAFGSAGVGLVTGLLTLAILIIGNLIPKSWAANKPEKWTLGAAPVLFWLMIIFGPVVGVVDRVVGIFVKTRKAASFVSEEEIKTMAAMGMHAGTVERGEKELIERVFLFNDITAEDVMTPREGIVFLDGNRTLADVLPLINAAKFSRYPVFDKEKSNVVGIVHIKDLYERLTEYPVKPIAEVKLKEVVKPAIFIPETKLIDDLFREFQKNRMHMAMVVNEYGSITGLVTLEDLIEELVGEISDETDIDENIIKRVDKYTVIAHGDIEIQHVNRFFNAGIIGDDHKTLSRLLLEKLGSIPTEGQKVQLTDTLTAVVEQADGRRVHRIRLIKEQEAASLGKPE